MPLGSLQASICSVMVTGSCGFIGANLVRDLLRRFPNMRVCGVDRLDYNAMDPGVAAPGDPAERARLRFVRADICDRDRMLELPPSISLCLFVVENMVYLGEKHWVFIGSATDHDSVDMA